MTPQTEVIAQPVLKQTSRTLVKVTGAIALLLIFVAIGTFPRLARQHEALAAVRW